MAAVVNTNVMSLNAQRQLGKSQATSNQAMERLSSGLRINSAKDDAAGLAISTGMQSQIKGINQGVRNANDGVSMTQTAEGSMDEMTNILQRMRELSVQAANDTNSSSNRGSIQKEVDQLYAELDRIAETTQFNGINLLDGSAGSTTLQIGANSGETLSFSIDAVTTKDLNLNAVSGTGELNSGRVNGGAAVAGAGDVTINGAALGAAATSTAEDIATAVNAVQGLSGVSASAYNVVEGVSGATGSTTGFTINGDTVSDSSDMDSLVSNINRDVAGVTASLNNDGALVLSNDTGANIVLGGTEAGSGLTGSTTYGGYVSLNSSDGEEIKLGLGTSGVAADIQALGFNESTGSDSVRGAAVSATAIDSTVDGLQINGVDLGDVDGSSAADKAFAINTISDQTGVTASAKTEVTGTTLNMTSIKAATDITINGATITTGAVDDLDGLVTAINGTAALQGVVASADDDGNLVLTSNSGSDIAVVGASMGDAAGTFTGKLTLTGEDGKDVIVTSNAATEAAKATATTKLGLTDQGGNSTAVGTGLSVTSASNASNSIDRIDDALNKITESRGKLGAIQNRLGSTISNLENVSQNLSAANSRIQDADFAAETSKMSKSQILQQAGTSMLAQANASSQSVLSMLG